jgi:hypothetical protein
MNSLLLPRMSLTIGEVGGGFYFLFRARKENIDARAWVERTEKRMKILLIAVKKLTPSGCNTCGSFIGVCLHVKGETDHHRCKSKSFQLNRRGPESGFTPLCDHLPFDDGS